MVKVWEKEQAVYWQKRTAQTLGRRSDGGAHGSPQDPYIPTRQLYSGVGGWEQSVAGTLSEGEVLLLSSQENLKENNYQIQRASSQPSQTLQSQELTKQGG